jgi:hypothetical protein
MDNIDGVQSRGSGRDVEDYCTLCEGDIDPTLNKKIDLMISCEKNFIVYLDDDSYVQWSWNDAYGDDPPGYAQIASRIGHIETLSATQLNDKQREHLSRLLAEGMARAIGEKDEKKANETLDDADAYMKARGDENARIWYLTGALGASCLSILVAFILWLFREFVSLHVGNFLFEVMLGASAGGPGALLSILYRSEKIPMEPAAGPTIHRIEGAGRTLAGNLGALLMAMAVKADLVLGIISSGNYRLPVLLAICFAAGTSERLVRGFINKMETETSKV